MRKLSPLLLCLLSTSAWATSYSIDLIAQIDASAPIKGHVVIKDGEAGSISYKGTTVKFTPTKMQQGSVKIQAQILQQVEGRQKVVSTPQTIIQLNQPAEISQKSKDGSTFDLTFTAKEI
jgi:hypothetical protein